MHDVFINAVGAYLPGIPISNDAMEEYLGYINGKPSRNRSLVLRQNRIKNRYYALDKQGLAYSSSADMAANAIKNALQKSEINPGAIGYLATASTLGDVLVPGLASHVHAELAWKPLEIASFQSVCGSAFMALKSAWLQLKAGEHSCAAVSGSEFASRYFRPGFYEHTSKINQHGQLDYAADFLRFTLSDGGGAALLEAKQNSHDPSLKIHWIDIRSYADRFETCMYAGGVKQDGILKPWSSYETPSAAVKAGAFALTQDFALLKKMMPVWVTHYLDLIDAGKIDIDEIDILCSHYSSYSLREETIGLLKKAGAMISEEKWFSNLQDKGNTGSASIFIMLEELFHSSMLRQGQKILCHVPESGRSLNGLMLLEVV